MKYEKYLPVFKRCGWNVNDSDNEIEIVSRLASFESSPMPKRMPRA